MRRAFDDLTRGKLIESVTTYSLLREIRSGVSASQARDELARRVIAFRPDIILMQHLGGTGLRDRDLKHLIESTGAVLIYHEADPYTRFMHPLPSEARAAARSAAVTFTVGSGVFTDNFVRAGATDVRWVPSVFDAGRAPRSLAPHDQSREFDFVMIANRNRPRWRGLPNWRDRIAFVDYMALRFGKRFAIFGRNWDSESAKGPIPYSEQAQALSRGWVAVNWDHFATEPRYFSDRLPTTLASGAIHGTTLHEGFSSIFAGLEDSLMLARSHEQLGDMAEAWLINHDIDARRGLAAKNREFAFANFRQDDQLVLMLNAVGCGIDEAEAAGVWSV